MGNYILNRYYLRGAFRLMFGFSIRFFHAVIPAHGTPTSNLITWPIPDHGNPQRRFCKSQRYLHSFYPIYDD
jgi:hypothetical protein